MIDKNKLYRYLYDLLNKAKIPSSYQFSAVAQMMDTSRYDMQLKVDIIKM